MKTYNRFPFSTSWDRTDTHHRLSLFDIPAYSTVLDAGCNDAGLAIALAKNGCSCTAIDQSPEYVALAKECAVRSGVNVDIRQERIEDHSGKYTYVICLSVLHWYEDIAQLVTHLASLCLGCLCLEIIAEPKQPASHVAERNYSHSYDGVRRLLWSLGFPVVECVGFSRDHHRTLIRAKRWIHGITCMSFRESMGCGSRVGRHNGNEVSWLGINTGGDDPWIVKLHIDNGLAVEQFIEQTKGHPCFLHYDVWNQCGIAESARFIATPRIQVTPCLRTAAEKAILCDALRFVHRLGFVHGDVKWDNCVRYGDRVILTDYGNVRRIGDAIGFMYAPGYLPAEKHLPPYAPATPSLDWALFDRMEVV